MKVKIVIRSACKAITQHAINSTFSNEDTVNLMGLTGNARKMLSKEWLCKIDMTDKPAHQVKFALSRYKEARNFREKVLLAKA